MIRQIKMLSSQSILSSLQEKGYCVIPNILNPSEITQCKDSFINWQKSIPQHDIFYKKIVSHGIYKFHHVGHTWHSWFIRTHPSVQQVFKTIYNCDDLIVSFDGCCHIPKECEKKDTCWTHTDQAPSTQGFQCYQGLVSLTDNQERTLVVYEGTHHIHESYFRDKGIVSNNNWQIIDPIDISSLSQCKKILHIPAGSLVLWDSRLFHQNQYGTPFSEERMIQYVCYFPKNHPRNTDAMKEKRRKYFQERRTTTHWPCPIHVVPLQPNTYGDPSRIIKYSTLPIQSLENIDHEEIMKLIL